MVLVLTSSAAYPVDGEGEDQVNPYAPPAAHTESDWSTVWDAEHLVSDLEYLHPGVKISPAPAARGEVHEIIEGLIFLYVKPWRTDPRVSLTQQPQYRKEYCIGGCAPVVEHILSTPELRQRVEQMEPAISLPLLSLAEFKTLTHLAEQSRRDAGADLWRATLALASMQRGLAILEANPRKKLAWRQRIAEIALAAGALAGAALTPSLLQNLDDPTLGVMGVSAAFLSLWGARSGAAALDKRAAKKHQQLLEQARISLGPQNAEAILKMDDPNETLRLEYTFFNATRKVPFCSAAMARLTTLKH